MQSYQPGCKKRSDAHFFKAVVISIPNNKALQTEKKVDRQKTMPDKILAVV